MKKSKKSRRHRKYQGRVTVSAVRREHPESTRSIAKALISMAGDLVKQEAFVREMLE
ncbi:hypothetical protein GA0061091_1474, partial [Gordonia sp. v-85]